MRIQSLLGETSDHSRSGLWSLLYALFLLMPLVWALGAYPLFDVDEGAFSQATRELLVSGDWGHTTLNGEARFDKPIGIYWLQALCVTLLGLSEFSLRLPSALSGWCLALVCAHFTARRWGTVAGAWTGVLLVSSVGLQMILRTATADALLHLLIVLAALDLWRFSETGRVHPLRRAYLWMGLGLLVKGPVAILVPFATFSLWCLSQRQWERLRSACFDVPGWLILLLVAGPWYLYALNRHGWAFVEGFILRHNLQRFAGSLEGHSGSGLYYLLVLPLLCMPWTPVILTALSRKAFWWPDALGRYLVLWVTFVVLFFSLASTKLPHYVLYGFTPLAILGGQAMAGAGHILRRVIWVFLFAWTALLASLPFVVIDYADRIKDPLYHALLSEATKPTLLGAIAVLSVMGVLALLPVRASLATLRLAVAGWLVAGWTAAWVVPWWADTLQGPVQRAAQVLVARDSSAQAVQWQVHLPSFGVYLQSSVPRRMPESGEWTLTREDRLSAELKAQLGPEVFKERGLVLLGPAP